MEKQIASEKVQALKDRIKEYTKEDVMVAFSGGVDSSLLLLLAKEAAAEYGTKIYAVTIQTRLHPVIEMENAVAVAGEMGVEHLVLSVDELLEAGIEENPVERCYLCKKHLFSQMKKRAEKLGVQVILEGTNRDDLKVYRPGLRAIRELGIKSPLAEAEISKMEVRSLAAEYGISSAKRPSMPCMATRFPYGTRLSYEALDKVEQGENYLRSLGFYNVRLRVHGDIARIEVDLVDFPVLLEKREEIISHLKELGFVYITLDMEGFRSGSMDVKLEI